MRATGAGHPRFRRMYASLPGMAGPDDLDRWNALLSPNCAQGTRWTASGITWLAPTSASSADATVTVHRVCTVSSTSSTGPSKLTPSRTLVRASRSRAGPLRPPGRRRRSAHLKRVDQR